MTIVGQRRDAACRPGRRRWRALVAAPLALAAAGCHQDMYDQPRLDPLEANRFFDDGRASRGLVEGTVAYQAPWPGDPRFTGKNENDGELVIELPVDVDAALLARGRERFNIYCSACHGQTGDGNGMIVQRGYTQPPTYHSDRLRGAPIGHFFDVITNGYGVMPSFAVQASVDDRWAIAAYVRALQWSRYASVDDLTAEQRTKLEATPTP